MIGTSCASIAMMEWDELQCYQPHIDVLISSTIMILYACHDIIIASNYFI